MSRMTPAVLGVAIVLALAACGSPQPSPVASPPVTASATAGPPATPAPVTRIADVGVVFTAPLDAVPASDGSATWFTATGASGPGVFVTRGGTTEPLVTGAPLRNPTGLALTNDEQNLLVADPAADALFTVPVAGGPPSELTGSNGLHPRGVEVDGDQLYLTGTDPATGTGAVFVLSAAGGVPRTVATGLAEPDGITVAPDGAVLVTDRPGSVLRLVDGVVAPLATGVRLGTPAGLTLTADGSALLVSSLDESRGTAQVLALDPATGARAGVFDDVIGANPAAGGLHRAHQGDTAAWADLTSGVYLVGTRGPHLH